MTTETEEATGVRLPAAVRKQNAEADALMEQLRNSTADPAPAESGDTEAAAVESLPTEGVAAPDAAVTPTEVSDTTTVTDGDTATASTVVEAAAPVADADVAAELTKRTEAFKTLQSKYNAEVPRFAKELRDSKADNERLLQMLMAQQQSAVQPDPVPTQEPSTTAPAVTTGDLFTADERERFDVDADWLDLLESKIRQAADEASRAQIQPVQERVQADAQRVFRSQLETAVPDFSQIDVDSDFTAWLAEPVPYAGVTRHQLLNDAAARQDAPRAAQFFLDFKASRAAAPNATVEPTVAAPAAPPVSPSPVPAALRSQVAPPKTPAGTPSSGPAGKRWTATQYEKLVQSFHRGELGRGPEARAKYEALDKDFWLAVKEGRVDG